MLVFDREILDLAEILADDQIVKDRASNVSILWPHWDICQYDDIDSRILYYASHLKRILTL